MHYNLEQGRPYFLSTGPHYQKTVCGPH